MIDAGEDMHHPHADELGKARAFQPAPFASRHIHRLMFGGDQLLGEFSGERILHLRKIRVAPDQIEKGARMDLQLVGRRASEREVVFSKARGCGQRLNRRNRLAALTPAQRVNAVRQIGLHAIVGWRTVIVRQTIGLQGRDRHHEINLSAFDLPYRVGFAAAMRSGCAWAKSRRDQSPLHES